jgi:hypothetical protein
MAEREEALGAQKPMRNEMRGPGGDQVPLPEGELIRLNDWAEPGGWALALFAGLAGILLLFTDPAPGSELSGPLRPVLAAIWLVLAFLAGSGARAGLVVRPEGIEVRWRIRSSTFSWGDISTFALRRSTPRQSLRVKLRDGRELWVVGFEARSAEEARRAEAMVMELNRRADSESFA